jgi:hypothetical protein
VHVIGVDVDMAEQMLLHEAAETARIRGAEPDEKAARRASIVPGGEPRLEAEIVGEARRGGVWGRVQL